MRRLKGERTEDETANLTKKIKVRHAVATVTKGKRGWRQNQKREEQSVPVTFRVVYSVAEAVTAERRSLCYVYVPLSLDSRRRMGTAKAFGAGAQHPVEKAPGRPPPGDQATGGRTQGEADPYREDR